MNELDELALANEKYLKAKACVIPSSGHRIKIAVKSLWPFKGPRYDLGDAAAALESVAKIFLANGQSLKGANAWRLLADIKATTGEAPLTTGKAYFSAAEAYCLCLRNDFEKLRELVREEESLLVEKNQRNGFSKLNDVLLANNNCKNDDDRQKMLFDLSESLNNNNSASKYALSGRLLIELELIEQALFLGNDISPDTTTLFVMAKKIEKILSNTDKFFPSQRELCFRQRYRQNEPAVLPTGPPPTGCNVDLTSSPDVEEPSSTTQSSFFMAENVLVLIRRLFEEIILKQNYNDAREVGMYFSNLAFLVRRGDLDSSLGAFRFVLDYYHRLGGYPDVLAGYVYKNIVMMLYLNARNVDNGSKRNPADIIKEGQDDFPRTDDEYLKKFTWYAEGYLLREIRTSIDPVKDLLQAITENDEQLFCEVLQGPSVDFFGPELKLIVETMAQNPQLYMTV